MADQEPSMMTYCDKSYHIIIVTVGNFFGLFVLPFIIFVLGTFNEFIDHDTKHQYKRRNCKNTKYPICAYLGMFTGLFTSIIIITRYIKDTVLCEDSIRYKDYGRYYLVLISCCLIGTFVFLITKFYIFLFINCCKIIKKWQRRKYTGYYGHYDITSLASGSQQIPDDRLTSQTAVAI